MQKVGRLLAALECVEDEIMSRADVELLGQVAVRAIVNEVLRVELERIAFAEKAAEPRTADEADAMVAALENSQRASQQAGRTRDYSLVREVVDAAVARLRLPALGAERVQVDRPAHAAMMQVRQIELEVEEGEPAASAAKHVLDDRFGGADLEDLRAPVLISEVVGSKASVATPDMRRKFEGVGRLLIAYFGDVPLGTLDDEQVLGFLLWYRRLPKLHGRAHGRNRFEAVGVELDPHVEIADADRLDEKARQEIAAQEDLSDRDKRAQLVDRLVARVTDDSVEKTHARLRSLFEHAVADATIRHRGYVMKSLLPRFRQRAKDIDNKAQNDDPFAIRVTQPKVRAAWSNARIAALAASPVYRGCSTPFRRWKEGDEIIRDAIYWVPLILLTTGMRPEEALQLRKKNILKRNGIWAFLIAVELEQSSKTEDSVRYVPIPDILLELGFVDWWRERLDEAGPMLFPEVATGSMTARLSDVFGKRVRTVFGRLDLTDAEEDLYALRKTFSSRPHSANETDSIRKAILGHKHGDILNRHYTQENLPLLKKAIDSVDLGLRVEMDHVRGFPVLVGCDLEAEPPIDVEMKLDEAGDPRWICIRTMDIGRRSIFESKIAPLPGWKSFPTTLSDMAKGESAATVARKVVELVRGHEVSLRRATATRMAFEALCASAEAGWRRLDQAPGEAA